MGESPVAKGCSLAAIILLAVALPVLAMQASPASAQTTVPLTVNTQYANGQALTGMWTTLSQNGQTVATGFSPVQFGLVSGQQYVVAVSNYGQIIFDHWADNGSTSPTRTVSISQAATLTAIYRSAAITLNPTSGTIGTTVTVSGSNFPPNSAVSVTYAGNAVTTTPGSVATSSTGAFSASFAVPQSSVPGQNAVRATAGGVSTTSTFTHTSSMLQLTVNSQYTTGQALTGMWTTLSQNGQMVATGFTPVQFQLTSGQQYLVGVGNYGQIVFDHWADNGSTSPTRTVSISQATTLTAVYRNGAANQPPVANNQSVTLNENSFATITLGGFDPEGKPIKFLIANPPAHGTLSLINASTNAVRYTPYDYYDGLDNFTFVTNDGSLDSSPATVNLTVSNTATKTTSQAVVITTELNGHTVTGMTAWLYQNNVLINQGFTHVAFDVNNGQQYILTADNYQNYLFDHWVDTGSKSPTRTFTISQDTPIYAVYKTAKITISPNSGMAGTVVNVTGDGFDVFSAVSLQYNGAAVSTVPSKVQTDATGGFTTTFVVPSWSNQGPNVVRATDANNISAVSTFTDTSTQQQYTLTVNSQNMSGGSQTGFYTTLSQNGQMVATGFTPAQFQLTSGQQYIVTVSNYGQWAFDHWADNGSTNPSRIISITSPATIIAVYHTPP